MRDIVNARSHAAWLLTPLPLRYTRALMARGVAILVTLAFSWILILPAFTGSAESILPPCCRKNGKHQCMMRTDSSSGSGPSFAAIGEKCPYFPRSTLAAHTGTFAPTLKRAIVAGIFQYRAISPRTGAGYRAWYLCSKQKRGPPPFLLS